jgi:hypothetical protein
MIRDENPVRYDYAADMRGPFASRFSGLIERPWVVWVASLAFFGAYCLWTGPRLAPDSFAYSRWADQLIATRFNYSRFLDRPQGTLSAGLYAGFITVVALLKVILGSHWAAGAVALNAVAMSLIAVVITRLTLETAKNRAAAWFAFAACLLCYEVFAWARFALSDVLFAALVIIVFAMSVAIARDPVLKTSRLIGATVVFALCLVFRPTGWLLIPLVISTIVLRLTRRSPPATVAKALLTTGATVVVAAFLLSAAISQQPSRYPLETLSRAVHFKATRDATGEVVNDRPELNHTPPRSYADYLLLLGDRFVRFFQFASRSFSTVHNVYSSLFFIPLYALVLIAIWRIFSNPAASSDIVRVVTLGLTYIGTVAAWHGMMFLDFDWRYRVPAIPFMIVVAAIGVDQLWPAARARSKT